MRIGVTRYPSEHGGGASEIRTGQGRIKRVERNQWRKIQQKHIFETDDQEIQFSSETRNYSQPDDNLASQKARRKAAI